LPCTSDHSDSATLSSVVRSPHARRAYDPGAVQTVAVIGTGQRAGLTLDEIKPLLSASPDDTEAIDRLREVADRKLPKITAQIERTKLVRDWLEIAARCECPSLDESSPCTIAGAGAWPRARHEG